ncbi:hypothetical protein BGW38_002396 [Lunasporangiospora selenospora]|uniref:F-box domain-containing protein n=1 Tax=Lunasporangiospora selenospora TaxID=979761 RepID=A0A9P6G0W6_9FUNG|nr:hypothetical protein BGW38_002396 [Lunasporangiospora selenospora]
MNDAVRLPEILIAIGPHLSRRSLLASVSVSKTWKHIFEPLLWTLVELDEHDYANESIRRAMARNGKFVKNLNLKDIHKKTMDFVQHCTRLHTLRLNLPDTTGKELVISTLAKILQHNQETLCVLDSKYDFGWGPGICQTLLACPRLEALGIYESLTHMEVDHDFWKIVARLKRLSIVTLALHFLVGEQDTFPNLTHLHMITPHCWEPVSAALASRCPNLIELSVADYSNSILSAIERTVLPKCRNLSTLVVNCSETTSQSRASFFKKLPPMKHFGMSERFFKPTRNEKLPFSQEHFHALVHIDLKWCGWARSTTVQELLSSCPNLQSFKAERLSGRDIEYGDPWVCLRLEELWVAFIDVEVPSLGSWTPRPGIYRQLQRLERLQIFDQYMHLPEMSKEHSDRLDFRLGFGLEHMAIHRRLRKLRTGTSRQELSVKDIKWMIQAWPELEEVEGILHFKEAENTKLGRFLERNGIRYRTTDLVRYDEVYQAGF